MRLVLLGAPGAGKGTQAGSISREYQIPHISTGEIFRDNIKRETPLGKEVKGILDSGQLVPDDITVKIVESRLEAPDCEHGFVLDGFPRNINQAESIDRILAIEGKELIAAIDIRVDDGEIITRLSGRRVCRNCSKNYHVQYAPSKVEDVCDECGGDLYQRKDDAPDVVKSRLSVYHNQTEPLIGYYKQRGVYLEVTGREKVSDTTEDMFAILEKIR
ncbi:MAG: adenylate kinase [Oscillospiraceae bacterium]|nr:adenylate kinase [Oscillospiraceae bacterium]